MANKLAADYNDISTVEYDNSQVANNVIINWETTTYANNDIVVYSEIEAIYKVPLMYIGSIDPMPRNVFVYNSGQMYQIINNTAEGVIRLFLEVLTNAGDNCKRSKKAGIEVGNVYVQLRNNTITIRNGGKPINIVKHPQFPELWKPEVIFGVLHSSSNYVGDREGAGLNGLGVKLVNIFSSAFEVRIGDPENGVEYCQLWEHNMRTKHVPQMQPYQGEAYVQVSYTLDFARFGMQQYSEIDLAHFAWLAASLSLTEKIKVDLDYLEIIINYVTDLNTGATVQQNLSQPNMVTLNYIDPLDYAKTIFAMKIRKNDAQEEEYKPKKGGFKPKAAAGAKGVMAKMAAAKGHAPEIVTTAVPNPNIVAVEQNLQTLAQANSTAVNNISQAEDKHGPRFVHFTVPSPDGYDYLADVVLADTPHQGDFISFVNGPLPTWDGGKHIDTLYHAFGDPMLTKMKDMVKNDEDEKVKIGRLITISHIKNNVSMLVCLRIKNPNFGGGQSKTKLHTFPYKVTIPIKVNKILSKWSLLQEVSKILDEKYLKLFKAKGGSKTANVYLKAKEEDANEAGKTRALECTLWICEGDSASSYLVTLFKYLPGGRDLNGILPIRGKLLNVINASYQQLSSNRELELFMKMLGLKPDVDYSNPANQMRDLRYGKIRIAADADPDGKHIIGLGLNMLLGPWKELLDVQFVGMYRTPIRRATKGNQVVDIYTSSQEQQFMAATDGGKGWSIHYCKGIGGASPNEIDRDAQNNYWVDFVRDEVSEDAIHLAFDND